MTRNRWTMMAVLALARTAMAYQMQSVGSLSPFLISDLDIDYAALGTLIGLYMLPGVVIALPGGVLGQRFGDTRMCLLGLALMTAGGVLMGVAESYAVASFGRIVSGLGGVILNVLLTKMVADWFVGREIITAMALFVNSWPLGIALGLMTQGLLAEVAGWPAVMHVAAMICAISLVLVALIYRPPLIGAQSPSTASFVMTWRLDLKGHELTLILLAGAVWALYNVGFIVVVSFAPDFLTAAGRSVGDAGAIVSMATWLMLISVPLGGFLAERSGRPNLTLVSSLAAYGAVTAALTIWDAPILLFVIVGVMGGVPAGIIMALPARAVRAEVRAPAMGLYFTCYYVGMAALPALAGWIRDTTGYAGAPLLFASAILIVALISFAAFCWVERRYDGNHENPEEQFK